MPLSRRRSIFAVPCSIAFIMAAGVLHAQLTPSDYERALSLQDKYQGLAVHLPSSPVWIEGTHRFVYVRSTAAAEGREAGHEYVHVDAETHESRLAFDH